MYQSQTYCGILFLTAPLIAPVFAEELETITVTGQRIATSAEAALVPLTIVSREMIEAMQAQSLSDVLRTLPNVDINQNGGRGQLATVSVRGGSSRQTLVLIDGMRSPVAAIGPTNINQIPLEQVERVEFLRGARASLYGSDGISGVVNIITRATYAENATELSLSAGSQASIATSLRHTSTIGPGQLKFVAGYEEEEGYNSHPISGVNDGDKHGLAAKNALLSYALPVMDSWDVYTAVRWAQQTSQYDNSQAFVCEEYDPVTWKCITGGPVQQRKENWVESFDYQFHTRYQGQQWQSVLQAQISHNKSYDYIDDQDRHQAPDFANLRQHNLAWISQVQLSPTFDLSGGIDWRHEDLRPDSNIIVDDGLRRNNTGIFALAHWQYAPFEFEFSSRFDDNQQFGQHTTWQFGGEYQFTEAVAITTTIGTAFRAPTFYDLYYPGYDNPDLKPEETDHYELALQGFHSNFDWRLAVYRQDATNLIQGDENWIPQNIGKARTDGFEAEATATIGLIEHRVSYSYRDARDQNLDSRIKSISRHNAKWDLFAQWAKLETNLNLIFRSSHEGWDGTAASYTLANLAFSYPITAQLKASARVENLFDKTYESSVGYPGLERSLFGRLQYQF